MRFHGLIALCTLGILMANCTPCPNFGDNSDDVPAYVNIQSMQVKAKTEIFKKDRHRGLPFEVSYAGTYYAFLNNHSNFSFPLFSSAKACPAKPPKGYKGSKEKLDSIVIQTALNFNDSIRKWQVINDWFYVKRFNDSFSSIGNFLKSKETQLNKPLSLYLKKRPDTNSLKCTFWFRLDNGETYRDTSKTIKVEQ